MKTSTRIALLLIAIILIPMMVKLQMSIDPDRQQFQPGRSAGTMMTDVNNNPVVLPTQFVVGTLIGFREVIAGLLWVRVNDFFHTGNYEAIVPLTRIITWLDPHQIDVYCTGAWHLAYNFVDSQQRADYRYLAPAIKFLEEGTQNNLGIWDTEFDLGFVLYRLKAYDYEKSLYWIKKADSEKNVPDRIDRQVAHAYELNGQVDKCIAQWQKCVDQSQAELKRNPNDLRARDHYDISKRNMDERVARKLARTDLSSHRTDVKLEAELVRVGPRQFIIKGTANLPDYSKIDIMLTDADYKEPNMKNFNWQLDPNSTIVADIGMHGITVEDGKFERQYNLSKDIKQYPFMKDRYVLSLTFDPRSAVYFVQDTTGWNGEGITDKKYLDTSIPGLRRIRKVINLSKKDLI